MPANKPKPIAPYDGKRSGRANDVERERDFDRAYRTLVAQKVDTGQTTLVTQKSLKDYDLAKQGPVSIGTGTAPHDATHSGHMKREAMHQYQK